jgi:hypothetical protein
MDNVDMTNLSTDMQLGGKLAAPIGSSEFTVKDLLERYDQDSLFGIGVDDDGMVMLYVENFVSYKTPDLSEKFSALTDDVMKYSIETQPLHLKEVVGFDVSLTPQAGEVIMQETEQDFDFNSLNSDHSVQKINRLLFKQTTIEVKVNTHNKDYPPGFLVVTVHLPGTKDSIVIDVSNKSISQPKTNLEVQLNSATQATYAVKFKITGDGSTQIATNDKIGVSIEFTKSDYIVYGHFYYNEGKNIKMEPYKVDLFSYLPEGTSLRFFAPSFKFNVTSNMGVPFIFDMDTIASTYYGASTPSYAKVDMRKDTVIARAGALGESASSTITLDNTSFSGSSTASDIFTTALTSIGASYAFRTPGSGDPLAEAEQFIASDSWLKMTASAQLPIWLDKGSVIAYADTLEFDDIDIEDYDYITNAVLLFTYTSYLPLGFDVTITLLDKNKSAISVANPNRYSYAIEAAPVDDDGNVNPGNPEAGEFSIEYDRSVIDDLKKTKYLKISVKASGATQNSKIKITDNGKLSVKVGLRTEGGLTVEGKF